MVRASALTTNALFSGTATAGVASRLAAGFTGATVSMPVGRALFAAGFVDASAREREPQARATAPARSSGIRMRVFIVKARIGRHRMGAGGRPLTHPSGAEVINS